MSESKVLETVEGVSNLFDLRVALQKLSLGVLHQLEDDAVATFGNNGEPLTVSLIEDTLTDGSKVYNLYIR